MAEGTDFPVVSIHHFKTHLSRYIRALRRGEAKGIVVRRYKRKLVMLIAINMPRGGKADQDMNLD